MLCIQYKCPGKYQLLTILRYEARLPIDLMGVDPKQLKKMHVRTVPDYEEVIGGSICSHPRNLGYKITKAKRLLQQVSHTRQWLFIQLYQNELHVKFIARLGPLYIGPYTVLESLRSHIQHAVNFKQCIVHFDRLKPCRPDVLNPRPEARIDFDSQYDGQYDSGRPSEATFPGTHTHLFKEDTHSLLNLPLAKAQLYLLR